MSISAFFTVLLIFILVLVAIFEFGAILLAKKFREEGQVGERGTISWHFWWMRARWWGRAIVLPLWLWPLYHFYFEPEAVLPPIWWDDIVVVVAAIATGIFLVKPRKRDLF